ncbi:MAG: YdeI/OmpD-associated family protein [Bacteroidota bacterium]
MDKHSFFKDKKAFRKWLGQNHDKVDLLWVCYYKKHTGKPSITWEESVEEALCYGWIDGIRKTIDEESYKNRFTPRRKGSNWSKKNIETVERLIHENRMNPAGLAVYSLKKKDKSEIYSYEQSVSVLSKEFEALLKADKRAWKFYQNLTPSRKKMSVQWVMSAKREDTRQKRFEKLLESCREMLLIPPLRWTKKK